MSFDNKIWNKSLDDIVSESFGRYAKYIIQDRALPDIRDGLKPVQRRILYSMYELKILHDKQYKKSARTVGEVIGKYHPHGDSSIYEAMVRMSQEWKNNIPLIDMQGNKGSIDGDSAAAMRYTECRLSKFGETLLNLIDNETVKFIPNFDDSENEPSILPSLLPNVLVNGTTGIAAGYATNVPPFNLKEVIEAIIYRINNPNCSMGDICQIIKGPDFPTGGTIEDENGILNMMLFGKGKFNILAKIDVDNTNNKKNNLLKLVVSEIPYETNKANIVKSIEEMKFNNELPGLKEIRDDSDKDGISILLEFETNKDPEIIKQFLYKKTQLKISYSANIILIKDRKPIQCNIINILDSFIDHVNEVVVRSANFELKKHVSRKEIVEGIIKCVDNIDLLINLIRSSTTKEEAKNKLIENFNLTNRQAEAVVQLRLYYLTSFDKQQTIDEYVELLNQIDLKLKLINNKNYRNKHIIKLLNSNSETLIYDRRTKILSEFNEIDIDKADIIENYSGVCYVTNDGYIKFILNQDENEFDLSKFKIKENDIVVDYCKISSLDYLIILTNKGKYISIPVYKIKPSKFRDNGIHVNEFITIDSFEKVVSAFAISSKSYSKTQIVVATSLSQIKRFCIDEISIAKNPKSSIYINLKNNDYVVSAFVLNENSKELISFSESGHAIKFLVDEVPIVGRTASGVRNINLKNNDKVIGVVQKSINDEYVLLTSNRGIKRISTNEISLSGRATIGKKILVQVESKPYKLNFATIINSRESIYLLDSNGTIFDQKVSDIPITDSLSRMNNFSNNITNLIKASYINLNKNIIIDSETENISSANSVKNEDKKEDIKQELVESDFDEILNTKIPTIDKKIDIDEIQITYDPVVTKIVFGKEIKSEDKNTEDTNTIVSENVVEPIEEKIVEIKEDGITFEPIDLNSLVINQDENINYNEYLFGDNEIYSLNLDQINNENELNEESKKTTSLLQYFDYEDKIKSIIVNTNDNLDNIDHNNVENHHQENIEEISQVEENNEINVKYQYNNEKEQINIFDQHENENNEEQIDNVDQQQDDINIDDQQNQEENNEIIEEDNPSLIDILLSGEYDKFEKMVLDNIGINDIDSDGQTCLMILSSSGVIDYMRLLINHGADINVVDKHGYSALMYAVDNDQYSAINELLINNANVNIKSENGYDALMISIDITKSKRVAKLLLKYGANATQEQLDWINSPFDDEFEDKLKNIEGLE